MSTVLNIPSTSPVLTLNSVSPILVSDTNVVFDPFLLAPSDVGFLRTNAVTIARDGDTVYTPTIFPTVYPSAVSGPYVYDAIGDNPIAFSKVNRNMRYLFLDKWLYRDFPQILKMLKITDGSVSVISKNDEASNDISTDSQDDLQAKSDFIGENILTSSKNKKILYKLMKTKLLKIYDMDHNPQIVKKAQKKYVIDKLKEMQN